ncbi:MAG: hypothetical protein KGJ56_02910 [Gammaproteobacteria bacterium]|nr:hypothetical protein [Gammaproteobacteria bacterium]
MEELAGLLFGVTWILFGIIVLLNFYFVGSLLKQLKEKYQSVWNSLGSPTLFWNSSPKNQIATIGFVYKGKYKQLNDSAVTQTCKKIFLIHIIGYIMFPIMVIFYLIMIAKS